MTSSKTSVNIPFSFKQIFASWSLPLRVQNECSLYRIRVIKASVFFAAVTKRNVNHFPGKAAKDVYDYMDKESQKLFRVIWYQDVRLEFTGEDFEMEISMRIHPKLNKQYVIVRLFKESGKQE